MFANNQTLNDGETAIEIMAFTLHEQAYCVRTRSIREIRSYSPATPVPHAPPEVMGIMNLRGSVIPVVDLAAKLGMARIQPDERCAIIVAEVADFAIGLVVDRVSDILSISPSDVQPMPDIRVLGAGEYSDGIVIQPNGINCFLSLDRMFANFDATIAKAA